LKKIADEKNMFDVTPFLAPLRRCKALRLDTTCALIVAAGFEDRALAGARILKKQTVGHAIILSYKPENKKNRLDDLQAILRTKGVERDKQLVVEYDRYNPEGFSNCLVATLLEAGIRSVVLDVSAMSKLATILVLDVCRELNLDVNVVYVEAKSYGPIREDYEQAKREKDLHRPSIQLYTGVHKVIRVSRLSSVAMQGQPSAAIVFMSFNEVLTQALLNTVYPSRLLLINGKPPKLKWREEATAWIHEQLRQEWLERDNPLNRGKSARKSLPERVTSTLDYRETLKVLVEVYWSLAIDHRIILAPTGSKMQAIACFFAKALHPDIHVEYPTPSGFLDLYSKGVGKKWIIRFGRLGDRVGKLKRVERKKCLEVSLAKRTNSNVAS
jgi:hypothetical protein